MVGKFIKDSTIVNITFDVKFINLSTSKTINEIGKILSQKYLDTQKF